MSELIKSTKTEQADAHFNRALDYLIAYSAIHDLPEASDDTSHLVSLLESLKEKLHQKFTSSKPFRLLKPVKITSIDPFTKTDRTDELSYRNCHQDQALNEKLQNWLETEYEMVKEINPSEYKLLDRAKMFLIHYDLFTHSVQGAKQKGGDGTKEDYDNLASVIVGQLEPVPPDDFSIYELSEETQKDEVGGDDAFASINAIDNFVTDNIAKTDGPLIVLYHLITTNTFMKDKLKDDPEAIRPYLYQILAYKVMSEDHSDILESFAPQLEELNTAITNLDAILNSAEIPDWNTFQQRFDPMPALEPSISPLQVEEPSISPLLDGFMVQKPNSRRTKKIKGEIKTEHRKTLRKKGQKSARANQLASRRKPKGPIIKLIPSPSPSQRTVKRGMSKANTAYRKTLRKKGQKSARAHRYANRVGGKRTRRRKPKRSTRGRRGR